MPPAGRVPGGRSAHNGSSHQASRKRDYHAGNAAAGTFNDFSLPRVDLSKLETSALKKYRRHFKLMEVGPNSSKEQLLFAVCRHFTAQQLDERQVIMGFVQAAKRLKT